MLVWEAKFIKSVRIAESSEEYNLRRLGHVGTVVEQIVKRFNGHGKPFYGIVQAGCAHKDVILSFGEAAQLYGGCGLESIYGEGIGYDSQVGITQQ